MNLYLFHIGSFLTTFRKTYGYTQEQLANKLGISRTTLVKVEKNPSKMTKIVAIALFTLANAEIQFNAKRLLNLTLEKEIDTYEEFRKAVEDLKSTFKIDRDLVQYFLSRGYGYKPNDMEIKNNNNNIVDAAIKYFLTDWEYLNINEDLEVFKYEYNNLLKLTIEVLLFQRKMVDDCFHVENDFAHRKEMSMSLISRISEILNISSTEALSNHIFIKLDPEDFFEKLENVEEYFSEGK